MIPDKDTCVTCGQLFPSYWRWFNCENVEEHLVQGSKNSYHEQLIEYSQSALLLYEIKDAWHTWWFNFKYKQIRNGSRKNGLEWEGGFFENREKIFHKFGSQRRQGWILNFTLTSWNMRARQWLKEGIRLGMDGTWSEKQLTEVRQKIIAKPCFCFDWLPVSPENAECWNYWG